MWINVVLYQNVNFDNYLTEMVIAIFFSNSFEAQGQGSKTKHEENEWDVHIMENLIILKLH